MKVPTREAPRAEHVTRRDERSGGNGPPENSRLLSVPSARSANLNEP